MSEEVVVYNHPNPEIRSFLPPENICPPVVEHFKKPVEKDFQVMVKRLGLIGAQTVKEILAIPGVKELHMKPKEVIVKKESWVSWDGIETRILRILARAVRKKHISVVKS
ncbi:MAG: NifU N-terminal domain-containing protein [Deltaproteobacteria bacterium]|nr:NifU N-terminal domain-containing protein [Deltaproteobacteria bacterium]